MTTSRLTRRGVALLLVLAVLIVTLTAAAAFARAATTARLGRTIDRSTEVADDMLAAAEAPILAWLNHEADTILLSPDVTEPRVRVVHDEWTVRETPIAIRITAWDQCGMMPVGRLRRGSPLMLAIPDDVRRLLENTALSRKEIPGLDLFTPGREDPAVYPVPPVAVAARYSGADAEGADAETHPDAPASGGDLESCLGAFIATHNGSRINVYTAPAEVLKAAYRAAGRRGLDAVLEARATGERIPIAAAPRSRQRADRLEFAGTSTAWAFRIDIRVGTARRAWWAVYIRSDPSWECVQRLAILT